MRVSEIFYALQGEGPYIGTPAVFVRLAGCNLHCEWCDTLDVWCKGNEMSAKDVASAILEAVDMNPQDLEQRRVHIVITGGEPLLHDVAINEVMNAVQEYAANAFFELETNGTLAPSVVYRFNHINCSPKLSNSGEPLFQRANKQVISRLNEHPSICYKFVVSSEFDWQSIQADFPWIDLQGNNVYLMPKATTAEELTANSRLVWSMAEKHRVKFATRLQTATWGNMRGK